MKLTLISLVLIMTLITACSGQSAVRPIPPAPQLNQSPTVTPALSMASSPSPSAPVAPTLASQPSLPTQAEATPTPECGAVFSPAGFTPDGKYLVGIYQGKGAPGVALQLLESKTMAAKSLLKMDVPINASALSPDGKTFAWALPDFSIQLINTADGSVTATLTGHTGAIYALLFSPDGRRLYSTSADWSVMVWDVAGQTRQIAFQPVFLDRNEPGEVQGMGISPDGKTLVTIPTYGHPRGWDTSTFNKAAEYPTSMVAGYTGSHAGFSPDGKYLAIGFTSGPDDTTLWRVADAKLLWSGGMMGTFAFSPDGRLFADAERDATNRNHLVVRSVDGQTMVETLPALSDGLIMQPMFSPDSQTLVWLEGPVLRFWDIASQRVIRTYAAPCQ